MNYQQKIKYCENKKRELLTNTPVKKAINQEYKVRSQCVFWDKMANWYREANMYESKRV